MYISIANHCQSTSNKQEEARIFVIDELKQQISVNYAKIDRMHTSDLVCMFCDMLYSTYYGCSSSLNSVIVCE